MVNLAAILDAVRTRLKAGIEAQTVGLRHVKTIDELASLVAEDSHACFSG